jgi:hypothetical protein
MIGNNHMAKTDNTHIICPLTREGLKITMQAQLIEAAKDQRGQDVFLCVITTDYPGEMVLTYRMGTGHRVTGFANKRLPYPCTVNDWERSRPVAPSVSDVLTSIGMDCQTTREMPRDEADACDWIVAEMGLGGEGDKPGDTLRMVRALNKQLDDMRALLRHTGVDADHFADWAAGLDN